ncbi:HNH endonuclease [Sporosarcina aquimarina]|uniref:HNH endonuclease n=1 Tax=Sporosarcina aquimarina TaxID=114975 RepID=A0ABU4FYN1_9BACL|nr:HNH endonuclease [Sporosarcina aquimarina]MDW0109816.1 HNH endonuclease [Sporosarcina aquimarina]
MVSPIIIYKNDEFLFDAPSIQESARFLAKYLNTTSNKLFDHIERGYVCEIPYFNEGDEYYFVASKEIALNRRKELEERCHKNARRFWLVPANPNDYDVAGAFGYYDTLDWKRSYNYENGDILFMYVSGDVQRVRYKAEVIKGLVSNNEVSYDNTFWNNQQKYIQSKEFNYTRLRLIDERDTPELSLSLLRDYGLKGNIQGSMKLKGDLLDYIVSFFEYDLTEGYYPEEVPFSLEEGKRRTINVNVYERNPIARKKCMEYYGCTCQVCELNFEEKYGEIGKGFIHVHHIVPLHEIQNEYVIDPIKDLIPVCPNCHSMLHRKENGIYLTIEQLKNRLLYK